MCRAEDSKCVSLFVNPFTILLRGFHGISVGKHRRGGTFWADQGVDGWIDACCLMSDVDVPPHRMREVKESECVVPYLIYRLSIESLRPNVTRR